MVPSFASHYSSQDKDFCSFILPYSFLTSSGINPGMDSSSRGVSDQGRGSGCTTSAPAKIAPIVRTVCYIAADLVRLVSCVESMKPVLQSLYHRILLYPPPQHRTEAIRIMKEVIFCLSAVFVSFYLFSAIFLPTFRFLPVLDFRQPSATL